MTSAVARLPRDPFERYYTPPWAIDRLLDRLAVDRPDVLRALTWMEPACGDGAIVRAVDAWYARHRRGPRRWWLNDLRPPASAARELPWTIRRLNFIRAELDEYAFATIGITNPPYRLALRFLERLVERTTTPMLLLRLNWLEGAVQEEPARAAFLRKHPPDVYVLPNRPAYRYRRSPRARELVAKGTDATAYAWMVWGKPDGERGTIQLLDETPRAERRAIRRRG